MNSLGLFPALASLQTLFTLTAYRLNDMTAAFSQEMESGLYGNPQSLAMLPSYLTCPTGREQGIYAALDFGGTNVRAMLIKLHGLGRFTVLAQHAAPLTDRLAGYDYTTSQTTAAELFAFVCTLLAEIAPVQGTITLGHTFSFPCRQTALNDARLLHWTKELAVSGIVGHNVNDLLQKALTTSGLTRIRPAAIVNDAVTTLLTAAYTDSTADIGSICGTGHNTCYLEPHFPGSSRPMYINIEAGNFRAVPANRFDDLLDTASDRPGSGRLEKMCSGRYLGELLRLICLDFAHKGLLEAKQFPQQWQTPYAVTTQDLAALLQESSAELALVPDLAEQQRLLLRAAASLLTTRSARLVAATWTAVVRRIDPALSRPHIIAIDGSLYEKLPGYAAAITAALAELLGKKASLISCRLAKDGSGVGAALAACQGEKWTVDSGQWAGGSG